MPRIVVFSEQSEAVLEMLSEARRLAEHIPDARVLAAGWGSAEEWAGHGADEVVLFEPVADDQPIEAVVPALIELAREEPLALVLVAGTKRGKSIAGQLAAALDAPCVTDADRLSVDGGSVTTARMVYGGLAVRTEVFDGFPVVATFTPRSFEPVAAARQAAVRTLPVPVDSRVQVVERLPKAVGSASVAEADVVVCVGRGVRKEEDLQLARELAEAVGGTLACTRPIAEEAGWMPVEAYIGISGQKVKSRLYINLGVSGQVQHITGIRDAKIILTVNSDEKAPIWDATDYGIVGDLYEVVPRLTAEFKRAVGPKG